MQCRDLTIFRIRVFLYMLFIFAVVMSFPKMALSEEGSNVSEILEGFDDDTAADDLVQGNSEPPDDAADVLKGFDDDTFGDSPAPGDSAAAPPPDIFAGSSPFSIDGYFKIGSSYNFAHNPPSYSQTDWRGLSRLRTELQLDLNIDLPSQWQALVSGKGFYDFAYRVNGKDDYTNDVIDDYESEIELREAYLLGSITDAIDIKTGRQIVVWGKSDTIRVTDVINPLDMREPGMTDIEDLRLPLTMTRLDYYIGDFNLSAMAIHEIRFNKNPSFGSDFYPSPLPPPPENKPDSTLENTEFALALNGIFSGWDLSAYYADYYNDEYRFEAIDGYSFPVFQLPHDRLQMAGTTANIALGNWLLKSEAAFIHGLEFANTPGKKYDRIDVLAGFEYSGFSETTLSIEAANRHIIEFESALKEPPDQVTEDQFQSAFRFTRTFVNETYTLTVLASLFGLTGDDGAFERYTMEYDVSDPLSVLFGIVTYQSGDLPEMQRIGQNDRIFLEAKYSF
ncbi:MAG: DUF1302 family protein [Desulfobacteraceae bacterium]|nr:MAG: DUF1302 family protein [Desulfobacteraceae bacterium]